MNSSALLSSCGKHRYTLTRSWREDLPCVYWVMLNPSTADANKDDATIRRCIGYAMRWGFGGIEVRNLFTWRATDPRELQYTLTPNDEKSDAMLAAIPGDVTVIAAWGYSSLLGLPLRVKQVKEILKTRPVWCLGKTKLGYPFHPVRLSYNIEREVYWP